MDQQAPRDNRMYFVGEKTNLKAMDKALKHAAGKHQLFSHTVLSAQEIKKHCKKAHVTKLGVKHKKEAQKRQD